VFPEKDRLKDRPKPAPVVRDPGSIGRDIHIEDFVNCVRTRETPRSDVESVHRSTTLCHLANMAYLLKRRIHWDAAREEPIGDVQAKSCLAYQREYRKPWKLPMYEAQSGDARSAAKTPS
jgi:hypothetical protein